MAEKTGQESGAQPGATETGQETKTEAPTVELSTTEQIVEAARKMEESAASKETETQSVKEEKEEKEKKAAPYDQDPKWKSARAAEKSLTEILKAHDLDGVEDLAEMIKSGQSLQDILGTRDADQLTQDLQYAETHRKNLAFWKAKELEKADQELDPDDRAEKYKKELADFKSQQADKELKSEEGESNKIDLANYIDRVEKIVDDQGFDNGAADIAKLLLGVDNPFNTVDISDMKAVRSMADSSVKKLGDFIKVVQQAAVDKYASGKSEFTPISSTESAAVTTTAVEIKVPENETVEEGFARVNKQLLEVAKGGVSP